MIGEPQIPASLQYQPSKIELSESIEKAKAALLKDIKRSVYIYRVDCGGCNGCEIEIFSTITPVFDAERFGIKNMASPRHADILVYTGAVTRAMRMPGLRAYEAAPDPKLVVSYGACGCTGGIFHDNYCVWGGTDKIVPVDVYIPGCPPSPAQTIYGFATALGLLGQKLHHKDEVEGELMDSAGEPLDPELKIKNSSYSLKSQGWGTEQAPLLYADIPYRLRVHLEREARRMAGYLYGHELVDKFMDTISGAHTDVFGAITNMVEEENDPRKVEIYLDLKDVVERGLAGELQ